MPYQKNYIPDDTLHCKIAIYLTNVYGKPFYEIIKWLPEVMPWWGKSRIAGRGDKVCTMWAQSRQKNYRDSSFVRVSIHWLLVLLSLRYPSVWGCCRLETPCPPKDATCQADLLWGTSQNPRMQNTCFSICWNQYPNHSSPCSCVKQWNSLGCHPHSIVIHNTIKYNTNHCTSLDLLSLWPFSLWDHVAAMGHHRS